MRKGNEECTLICKERKITGNLERKEETTQPPPKTTIQNLLNCHL